MEFADMTEKTMQTSLFYWRHSHSHQWIIPNVLTGFAGEIDLLSVSRAGYAYGHEIKVSRSDLLAELRAVNGKRRGPKEHWHSCLRDRRHDLHGRLVIPNYYYFVTVYGIACPDDIPEYAGWIEFRSGLSVKKKAPQLHKVKMADKHKDQLGRSLTWRYWDLRHKLQDTTTTKGEQRR